MTYTPPASTAANFDFVAPYTAPGPTAVNFNFPDDAIIPGADSWRQWVLFV